jgi:hypothetical protein
MTTSWTTEAEGTGAHADATGINLRHEIPGA